MKKKIIITISILAFLIAGVLLVFHLNKPEEKDKSQASSGSGNVITTIKDTDNTNLVENVHAAKSLGANVKHPEGVNETYRWEVQLGRGTTYSFGLQEPGGVRPVVKMRNKDGWFVKYEPAKWEVRNGKLDPPAGGEVGSEKKQSHVSPQYPASHIQSPTSNDYVTPKVTGNSIEWEIAPGITAKYTSLKDRIKADYIVKDKSSLCHAELVSASREILKRVQDDKGGVQDDKGGVQDDKGGVQDDKQCGLEFLVEYNDSYSGDEGEELINGAGYLTHQLLPTGDIAWLGENGMTVFDMPKPFIKEEQTVEDRKLKVGVEDGGSKIENQPSTLDLQNLPSTINPLSSNDIRFTIQKTGTGTSLLSINIPEGLDYPIIVDPVVVDSSSAATATAYGNGRKLLKDQYGNLIMLCDCGAGNDNVWYKNKTDDNANAGTWADAAVDLDGGGGSANEISADLDAAGDIHLVWRQDATNDDIIFEKLTVTRDGTNQIGSISSVGQFTIDSTGTNSSGQARRPSLIVANKNEGAGKEKVAVAWAMNSPSGGTKRGEIRFAQCDVFDGCVTASNWKNASEEVNMGGTCTDGTAGVPNAIDCAGAADVLFQYTADHTTHHAVLTQVPGRPPRTPMTNGVFKDINGTLTSLPNANDDNTGTTADVSSLDVDLIYVGDTTKFSRIVVDITNTNSSQAFNTRQYCSANSDVTTACDTWTVLDNFIDNTVTSSIAFSEDGSILFDEPSNWVESTEGPGGSTAKGFWVRLTTGSAFDATVSIAEIEVTDRHSKDLLIVGGVDATDDLRAGYVIWDFVGQAGWENNPADADDPWRVDAGGASSTFDDGGGNWTLWTNFALTSTVDHINNNVYVGWICDANVADRCSGNHNTPVIRLSNNQSLVDRTGTVTGFFVSLAEQPDMVLSLTSDGSDIYMFYVVDPDITGLLYQKCGPNGQSQSCDASGAWGAENTLSVFSSGSEEPGHPQAIVSKAFGDTVAIDVVYTNLLATPTVKYERHLVDMANITEVVAASGDDAFHRDCDTGTDDQSITATPVLGREADDAGCSPTTVDSENHVGFRFTTLNVAQGARISSAYLDFRVITDNASSVVDFTIYGEDTDDSAAFSASTDCTDPCSGAVGERTQTTSSTAQSINFETQSYRIDVTDLVQEIVCRGINNTQPCVGNFNGNGLSAWAANNDLAFLLISAEGGAADNNGLIIMQDDLSVIDPTLQINCAASCSTTGNLGRNYTMGLRYPHQGSGSTTDLDHPISALQFGQVGTDDTIFASMSASLDANASTSAVPIYLFKANNSNNSNTSTIDITVILKSSIPAKSYGGPHATGREIRLEVYRDGSINNWVPPPSGTWNTTTALADTDITLTGTVNASNTEYFRSATGGGTCDASGSDCWTYWRLWQDRAYDANQILYVDSVAFTFGAATSSIRIEGPVRIKGNTRIQ